MRNRIKMFVASLAVAVFGAVGLTGSPALAAWSDCNSANICIYNGTNGTGLMYQWTLGYIRTLPSDCLILTGSQNNMASSVYLNASLVNSRVSLMASGTTGASVLITASGFQDANMNAAPGISGFDNTTSAICVHP